jgi:hypothetical protein
MPALTLESASAKLAAPTNTLPRVPLSPTSLPHASNAPNGSFRQKLIVDGLFAAFESVKHCAECCAPRGGGKPPRRTLQTDD